MCTHAEGGGLRGFPQLETIPLGSIGEGQWELERGRGKVLCEHSCSNEAGSQMAEAVGLAHMVSWPGARAGTQGPENHRATGLGCSIYRSACDEA